MKIEERLYRETQVVLEKVVEALQEKVKIVGPFEREECKDAVAWELDRLSIPFERQKHFFRYLADGYLKTGLADFHVQSHVILMVACAKTLTSEHIARLKRAMHAACEPIGYILNAGEVDGPRLHRFYLAQYMPDPIPE